MRHLRAFLVLSEPCLECEVSAHRDLESVSEAWAVRRSPDASAALHVGFWRPGTDEFAAALSAHPGRMLLSESAAVALPPEFTVSRFPVAEAGPLRLRLALRGWGYDVDDPSPAIQAEFPVTGTEEHSPLIERMGGDWFADLASRTPSLAAEASAAGVRGEESYLNAEAALPPGLRGSLGMARFLYYAGGCMPDEWGVIDFIPVAPPWMLSLPLSILDLSTRPRNVLAGANISAIGDLASRSASEIMRLQNLGRKSFQQIGGKLLEILRIGPSASRVAVHLRKPEKPLEPAPAPRVADPALAPPEAPACPSYREALSIAMSLLTAKEKELMRLRMGLDGPRRTLDSIASGVSLTRERIRQIESRCITKMSSLPVWDRDIAGRLRNLLNGRADPLPLGGLAILDSWFEGADDRPDAFEYVAERLLEAPFHIVTEGMQSYVTEIRQAEWDYAKRSARRMLEGFVGKEIPKAEARRLVEGLLAGAGSELRSELWFAASRHARFADDGGPEILVSYGLGAESKVEALLASSDRPLHYTEIHRILADAGEDVEMRRAHQAAGNVGLLYGRGRYGTMRHFPLNDTQKNLLIHEAEDIVAGNGLDRQWHAREICDELEERGLDFDGRLDPYVLSIALRNSDRLAYLGRMVWASVGRGSKGVADRLDVRQAVAAVLIATGRPLSTEEIKARLTEQRGLNCFFQVQPEGDIVRVGTGLWGLMDRDLPFPATDARRIVAEIRRILIERQKGLHVSEVRDAVAASVPSAAAAPDPVVFFGLAQKSSGLSVGKGQYVYLTEWGDPRRPTVYDATVTVLSEAGRRGLSSDEGVPRIEALIGRPLGKGMYGSCCNNVGALYDETAGRWYLGPDGQGAESDEDTTTALTQM